MKKCPACGKTFDDTMKFCQVDGTELVADEPAFDPYATVIGRKLDTSSEPAKPAAGEVVIPPIEETPAATSANDLEEPRIHETTGSIPIAPPDEVLELPGADPLKTMYVSEAELNEAFRSEESKDAVTEESIRAEPPAVETGGVVPPPSPFSAPEAPFEQRWDASPDADAETVLAQNATPPFKEAETVRWTPPPVQEESWQNQQVAANAPFQPVQSINVGQSKGLAIGSLVSGILSLLCCLPIITGPAALVMGFIAKKKADENPSEFGGRGLALGGMITGGIGILIGIGQIIWIIFWGGLNLLSQ
jgi:hypothetical protein